MTNAFLSLKKATVALLGASAMVEADNNLRASSQTTTERELWSNTEAFWGYKCDLWHHPHDYTLTFGLTEIDGGNTISYDIPISNHNPSGKTTTHAMFDWDSYVPNSYIDWTLDGDGVFHTGSLDLFDKSLSELGDSLYERKLCVLGSTGNLIIDCIFHAGLTPESATSDWMESKTATEIDGGYLVAANCVS